MFFTVHSLYFLALACVLFSVPSIQRYRRRRQLIKTHGCKPAPSLSQKDSVFGIDTLMNSYASFKDNKYLEVSQERFRETGHTYQFSQLGSTVVNTIDPENVKAILSSKFADFSLGSKRREAFEPLIGHGIFTADGTSWEKSRQIIRPSFAKQELNDLPALEVHVQSLLNNIPNDETAIDLQQTFLGLTIDYATEFLFGQSTSVLDSEHASEQSTKFGDAFDRAQKGVTNTFALGPLAGLVQEKDFADDKKTVQGFADQYVDSALDEKEPKQPNTNSDGQKKYTFIDEFSKHTQDPSLLRGGLLNVLLAGRDTTASLLSNLWFLLARHPEVWSKLKNEIATLDGKQPSPEELKDLKFLKNCINETLRLRPPIPRNSRTAVNDTILPRGGGPDGESPILIKEGTQVGYQIFSMHRLPHIYNPSGVPELDPEKFVPDRWDDSSFRPGWAYLPFNGGPRICIGQQFALTEAAYVVVRMMQTFDEIEWVGEEGWYEGLGLSCLSGGGCWVKLKAASATS